MNWIFCRLDRSESMQKDDEVMIDTSLDENQNREADQVEEETVCDLSEASITVIDASVAVNDSPTNSTDKPELGNQNKHEEYIWKWQFQLVLNWLMTFLLSFRCRTSCTGWDCPRDRGNGYSWRQNIDQSSRRCSIGNTNGGRLDSGDVDHGNGYEIVIPFDHFSHRKF